MLASSDPRSHALNGTAPAADPLYFCIEWNAENQLTRVTKNAVEQARFKYDPKGRRVEKVAGGVTTGWTYDDESILRHIAGATTLKYVHGLGLDDALATDDGSALSYFHADVLGSVVKTTGAAGVVALTRRYDAWGALEAGGTTSGYAFTGREHEPETGLAYYRARYYDSRIAAFLSEDPMGPRGTSHLYTYVDNNPVNFADPYGLYKRATGVPPVNPYMEAFLLCMDKCTGAEQTITATTNGRHADPGHAGGTSVDVRPTGTPSSVMFCCAARCGAKYGLDERTFKTKFGTGPHYHFQMDPPTNPKRDALPQACKPHSGDC